MVQVTVPAITLTGVEQRIFEVFKHVVCYASHRHLPHQRPHDVLL